MASERVFFRDVFSEDFSSWYFYWHLYVIIFKEFEYFQVILSKILRKYFFVISRATDTAARPPRSVSSACVVFPRVPPIGFPARWWWWWFTNDDDSPMMIRISPYKRTYAYAHLPRVPLFVQYITSIKYGAVGVHIYLYDVSHTSPSWVHSMHYQSRFLCWLSFRWHCVYSMSMSMSMFMYVVMYVVTVCTTVSFWSFPPRSSDHSWTSS